MPLTRSPSADFVYVLRNRDVFLQSATSIPNTTSSELMTTTTQIIATNTTGAIPNYSFPQTFGTNTTDSISKHGATFQEIQCPTRTSFETPKRFSELKYTLPEKHTYILNVPPHVEHEQLSPTISNTDKTKKSSFQTTQPLQDNPGMKEVNTELQARNTSTDTIIRMIAQATATNSTLIHTLNNRVEHMMTSETLRPNYQQLLSKIPNTDGFSPDMLVEFIIEMDEITNLEVVPFHNILKAVLILVQGELRSFLAICAKNRLNWQQVKKELLLKFLTRQQINRIKLSKIFRYQRKEESLTAYAQNIRRVACALDLLDDDSILAHIWDSCNSNYLQLICHIPIPRTFNELFIIAKRLEDATHRIQQAQRRESESLQKNL